MISAQPHIAPAHRIGLLRPSWLHTRLKEATEANARGAGIIMLAIGGPDKPPHSLVAETLCEECYREDVHSYQPGEGRAELRRAIADWYERRYGVSGLDPDTEVTTLMGSKEGLLLLTLALTNPGDAVLVPNPGNPAYRAAAEMAGAEVLEYELTAAGGWLPDFDALERTDLSRVRLMWANYTHMPTGTPPTLQLYERLVDFGCRHNIVIGHHNPYSFTLSDRPMSIMQAHGARRIAVELNSLSRSHNMAGWRMGMLVGSSDIVEWVNRLKANIDSGQFRPMERAAAVALELGPKWYSELNRMYARRRDIAVTMLRTAGCSVEMPQSGIFVWARIPDSYPSSVDFCRRLLDEARILVAPGSMFGTGGERYVRVSLCAPSSRLRAAVTRVEVMLGIKPRGAMSQRPEKVSNRRSGSLRRRKTSNRKASKK